jgi:hypothetical protein
MPWAKPGLALYIGRPKVYRLPWLSGSTRFDIEGGSSFGAAWKACKPMTYSAAVSQEHRKTAGLTWFKWPRSSL